MLADAALLQLALLGGLLVRFLLLVLVEDSSTINNPGAVALDYLGLYCRVAWPLTAVCLIVFYWNGFYTYGRHYQSRYKALVVSQAVTISFVLFFFLQNYFAPSTDATRATESVAVQDAEPSAENEGELQTTVTARDAGPSDENQGESQASITEFPRGAVFASWLFAVVLLVGARVWTHLWRRTIHPEGEAFSRRQSGQGRRVLVIGGAGYIGSALLPKLLERGYEVRLLDLLLFGESPIADYLDHPQVELIQGDFRHVENVVRAIRDIDSVIHLGAIVGDPACSLDEELSIDVNLSATRMIAELAKAANVDRFIFASTCSVYGACDEMLDEYSEVKPVSLYGHTKLASERVLRSMADERFTPTIVRFSTIYGLSGRTRFDLVVNLLAAKAKIEGEITVHGGDQWRPFVHVDDAARAVSMILDSPLELVGNQIYNVGSNDQNYTIQQIAELVLEQVVTAHIAVSDEAVDIRNYQVEFGKIRNQVGFEPRWTVEAGIQQVLEAIASGEVADYRDTRYSNVKFLTEAGTTGLARDNWARELIRSISAQ
jgi:nucleoside-diphosphate-sugar epimerase